MSILRCSLFWLPECDFYWKLIQLSTVFDQHKLLLLFPFFFFKEAEDLYNYINLCIKFIFFFFFWLIGKIYILQCNDLLLYLKWPHVDLFLPWKAFLWFSDYWTSSINYIYNETYRSLSNWSQVGKSVISCSNKQLNRFAFVLKHWHSS